MYKISIIYTVYNNEKYIEKSLTSLLEQSLDNVQFIIIDDGSTDNSLMKIKDIIEQYPRIQRNIKLVSRSNRGISATRNEGMNLAEGAYTIHLDSDDWVERDWLEKLYNNAIENNSDVVICDFKEIFAHSSKIVKQTPSGTNIKVISQILQGELHGSTCNKLVKRDSRYNRNNVFPMEINFLEDLVYIVDVLLKTKKITCVNEPLLNYNKINSSSITSLLNRNKIIDIINAISYLEKILNKNCELEFDINSFKLKTKLWLLLNANYRDRFLVYSLYKDIDYEIKKIKVNIYNKSILWISSKSNFLCNANIILYKKSLNLKLLFRRLWRY